MKKFMLFLLITLCFFSCTIEKRRYFKGYHVENGTLRQSQGSGKWESGKTKDSQGSKAALDDRAHNASEASSSIDTEMLQEGDSVIKEETTMASDIALDNEIATDGENIPGNKIASDEVQVIKTEEELISPKADVKLADQEPNTTAPKRVRNALIPFVIFGFLALLFGLKIGSGELGLFEFIQYFLAFVGYAFLAVVFLVIIIVRLVRRRKNKKNIQVQQH